jgi:hypothetical protein
MPSEPPRNAPATPPLRRTKKGVVRAIGAYSKPSVLGRLDHRTREYKLMAAYKAELTEAVGGRATNQQRDLIDLAAQLKLRIELMNLRLAVTGDLGDMARRSYLAWVNTLRKTLTALGVVPAPSPPPRSRRRESEGGHPDPTQGSVMVGGCQDPVLVPALSQPFSVQILLKPAPKPVLGRTRAGKRMRITVAELIQHCGGAPNPIQARLIDLAAELERRLAELDEHFTTTGKDDPGYRSLVARYHRTLRDLNVAGGQRR